MRYISSTGETIDINVELLKGTKGEAGFPGNPGIPGRDGLPGLKGDQGKSAGLQVVS
jgi:hypothetical protein